MSHKLYHGDSLEIIPKLEPVRCAFADPPDNIGLDYTDYKDRLSTRDYLKFLSKMVHELMSKADIVWISFNARWTAHMGEICNGWIKVYGSTGEEWELKPCVQVFTFGQHRDSDLGNNHRPLWRLMKVGTPLYPDAIRVPSWRQRNGDKRASSKGRVPGDVFDMQYGDLHAGDVFDFPRVTGNSKQRCDWHPTQLHEDLVARCIMLSTLEGETVLDPFAGTGTTLRVCQRINRACTLIELDELYCRKISEQHDLPVSPALAV